MWTLPTNAFTIRRIEKPLADLVQAASGSGSFDRLSVQIANKVCIERPRYVGRDNGRVSVFNVFSGETHEVRTVEERDGNVSYWGQRAVYWTGTLGPCDVFVRHNGHIVSIHVHQLWLDDFMRAELEVARDAILEAPLGITPPNAYKIAKQLLPFGHGLFVALIRKERGG